MKVDVKYIRSNGINDIFSYHNEDGTLEYIQFPRTMEMNLEEVEEHIN